MGNALLKLASGAGRYNYNQKVYNMVAQMLKTNVIPITADIAMTAANVSLEHDLPMADSLVYAAAVEYDCKVVTLDNDFRNLPRAEVIS